MCTPSIQMIGKVYRSTQQTLLQKPFLEISYSLHQVRTPFVIVHLPFSRIIWHNVQFVDLDRQEPNGI